MTRYSRTMSESLAEVREGFSPKQIKMAIGVASDKRYAGGNYSGAVKAIEKIKKGLSSHPQVAAVLKRQNEKLDQENTLDEDGHTDVASAKTQVKVAMSAMEKMSTELGKLNDEDSLPSWWTNKVAVAVDKLDGMADYLDTQVEKVECPKCKGEGCSHCDGKGYHMKEEVELNESSRAKRDAMKAMGRRGVDPADIDEPKASAADQELAKKNMISQLRKAKDTRGNFDLEFKDGKKQKIDSKVIDLLLKAHDMIQKPRDKEKFVDMISKSYRDMLNTAKMVSKQLKMGEEITLDEEIEPTLDEGKMKQFHMMQTDGKSAEEIAKALKLDLKTVKDLMKEELDLDEMKMDDPKLVKAFDKMKRGDTIKLKTSSTISKGKDFVEYIVKSKNTVNKGRVEKVTLVTKGNEGAVKKFLYKRDGKVTFAIGDMGASIDDIKENLDEMKEPFAVVDTADGNKVVGTASDEKGAKSIITTSELPPMKIKDKKTLKIIKVKRKQMIGQPIKEEEEPNKPDSAKEVEQGRDDKKKTRIAQLQLQIAKAQETINKINAQEK